MTLTLPSRRSSAQTRRHGAPLSLGKSPLTSSSRLVRLPFLHPSDLSLSSPPPFYPTLCELGARRGRVRRRHQARCPPLPRRNQRVRDRFGDTTRLRASLASSRTLIFDPLALTLATYALPLARVAAGLGRKDAKAGTNVDEAASNGSRRSS